jgi:hypothetical protein
MYYARLYPFTKALGIMASMRRVSGGGEKGARLRGSAQSRAFVAYSRREGEGVALGLSDGAGAPPLSRPGVGAAIPDRVRPRGTV